MLSLINKYKSFILFSNKSKFILNRRTKNKILNIKYHFFLCFLYTLYKKQNYELMQLNTYMSNYKTKWFRYIMNRLNRSIINSSWINDKNYYFWHFFNNDTIVNLLLNLLMKDGKKSVSYKHLYQCLFFIKKKLKINGLLLIKKLLLKKRIWFHLNKIILKKRILYIPKLLSIKNQFSRTLKYLFNNFNFKEESSLKKPYYKKLSYFLLDEFLYEKNLNYIMKKQFYILRKHHSFLYREEYKSKYMTKYNKMKKIKLFKKNRKSWNRKEKQLARFKRKLIKRNHVLDRYSNTVSMFNIRSKFKFRYELNLISRMKLKKKWSTL